MNGYRIHGMSHVEAVRCLRTLPSHIELVIARSTDPDRSVGGAPGSFVDVYTTTGDTLHVAASEVGSIASGTASLRRMQRGAAASVGSASRNGSLNGEAPEFGNGLPNASAPTTKVSDWVRSSQQQLQVDTGDSMLPRDAGQVS